MLWEWGACQQSALKHLVFAPVASYGVSYRERLAETNTFNELPEELRRSVTGCPYGVYTALWEEIAAEIDTSPEAENLLRRKAICNLYQYELAMDECSMPPGVQACIAFYLPQAGILEIPHPDRETGLSGCTCYVRSETMSPRQLEHIAWLRTAIDELPSDAPDRFEQKQQLLCEYYQRRDVAPNPAKWEFVGQLFFVGARDFSPSSLEFSGLKSRAPIDFYPHTNRYFSNEGCFFSPPGRRAALLCRRGGAGNAAAGCGAGPGWGSRGRAARPGAFQNGAEWPGAVGSWPRSPARRR